MKNTKRTGNRGRMPSGKPNPIDVHVGSRVRLRRTLMGLSQEQLGAALALTFQQVQKYERGANRVGASRLYDLARVLEVPVSFFFDDMPDTVRAQSPSLISRAPALEILVESTDSDPMTKRETIELVRAYHRITDPTLKKKVYDLTKALGGGS